MDTQSVNGVSASKKPVGKRDIVYGIVIDRLDAVSLRDAAREADLAFGAEDSSQEIAVSLQALYKKRQGEKKTPLYQCEVEEGGCGADQPRDAGACPFCGFDPDAKLAAEVERDRGAGKVAEEGPTTVEELVAEVEGMPAAGEDITDPEMLLEKTAPVEAPGPKPRGRPRKALPKGKEDVPGEMPPAGASTGLAKVVPASLMVVDDSVPASMVQTPKDLLAAEDAFHAANRATWVAWWHEGRALWEIFSKNLWKLLLDPVTKAPVYGTFQQYVSGRFKLTPNYVFDRMDAARAHTEAQAAKLGMSNCVLLMKAPEEVRQHIEAKIHKGEITTAEGTKAEVAKAIKEKGAVKTRQSKTGERKTGGGRKREFVKLAIAEQLGKSAIPMYATPEGGEKAVKITDVPAAVAKWLAKTQPFAQHESLDGEVLEVFGVVEKDGRLSLVVHRSRPADDEAE